MNKRIVFAAAGTAGHLEPALAVARWLRTHNPEISCEFISSNQGVEERLLGSESFPVHTITKAALPRRLSGQALLWPVKFLQSVLQVRSALRGADAVIGFGGYICAPVYLVSKLLGIPMLAHEANVLPGWANKLGVRLGAEPLLAFGATRRIDKLFAHGKIVGLPLRGAMYENATLSPQTIRVQRDEWLSGLGLDSSKKVILVFGGSLGARSMNSVLADAKHELTRANFQIVHAVGGKNELPPTSQGYVPLSYIEDMARAMQSADLVVSRSGAVTCAELVELGKYALLIPLEIGNGEQKFNASELESVGLATVVANSGFTSHYLSANIIRLMKAAEDATSLDLSQLRHPHATEAIGYELLAAATRGNKR